MERFKIACAQFPIIPNSIDANTEMCIKWIGRASKDHKANLKNNNDILTLTQPHIIEEIFQVILKF